MFISIRRPGNAFWVVDWGKDKDFYDKQTVYTILWQQIEIGTKQCSLALSYLN